MDSRLKRTALITSLCMILFIGGLVFFLNRENQRGASEQPSVTSGAPVTIQNGQIGNDLSAFLRDDTFFDPERNLYVEALLDASGRLNILVNSVERDLRIQITDGDGNRVTGESFFVTVEGAGEYKDLDQDGVIYIADLEPGEYQVSLKPMGDYKVPAGPIKVRVKEKLEYITIEDVGLLVKEEAEIDKELEDSSFCAAAESGDKSQITGLQEVYGKTVIGVDVSSLQEAADWDKVRESGIGYVIVRAGYRGQESGCLVKDSMFEQHIKGALLAGLPVGAVFRSQALTEAEAVEEASMVLELIKDYSITYPVFLDIQGAGGDGRADGLTGESRTAVAAAFCKTIENAGYKAGIYGADTQLSAGINSKELEAYCIWLAEYRKAPAYEGYYQMWQYTSKAKIAGFKTNINLNLSYLSLE